MNNEVYYSKEGIEGYIAIRESVDIDRIAALPEPERSMALYAYVEGNARGTKWQSIVLHENPFLVDVPSTESCGDFRNLNLAHVEFKVSYSDKTDNYSFLQCRPWENVRGYFFKCINKNESWLNNDYFLTKDEFLYELSIYGNLELTHGSKKDLPGLLTLDNAIEWQKELTYRLKTNKRSKAYERIARWNKLYLKPDINTVLENLTANEKINHIREPYIVQRRLFESAAGA